MKVCITGGAGYVGALLATVLATEKHEVTILDTFSRGAEAVLGLVPVVELVRGDVREGLPAQICREADAVIHLAAIVGAPACAVDPGLAYSTNVEGTAAVLRGLSKEQRFIYASTGSVYGAVNGICTEESPTEPLSVYGRTKLAGERLALDAGGTALRFATLYGFSPAMRLDLLLNDFCWQAVHVGRIRIFEGGHRRTFMHVMDAVDLYVDVLKGDRLYPSLFNAGDPRLGITKREAAEAVAALHPFEIEEAPEGNDPDQRDYAVDYHRQAAVGFSCRVSLTVGLREMLEVMPALWRRG